MSERRLEGGCLCGSVRFTVTGEPIGVAICHCKICRKAHAAPMVAWALFPEGQVEMPREKLSQFKSSSHGERWFCRQCGTQIHASTTMLPGIVDLAVGSLDEPEVLPPQFHIWHSRHLAWAEVADGLPRHAEFPPAEGGGD